MIGDSQDVQRRVLSEVPARWFASTAPIRDAIVGGLSDLGAWSYQWIVYARSQLRLATVNGPFLDIYAKDFVGRYILRGNLNDDAFRAKLRATILQERVTRAGMQAALTTLTGIAPIIFEPWNTGDTGAYDTGFLAFAGSSPAAGGGGAFDAAPCGWDIAWEFDPPQAADAVTSGGAGAWGSQTMPAQCLIIATVPGVQGIPNVAGFDAPIGAFDIGAIEWTDQSQVTGAVTNQDVLDTINATRPTGVICWTALN